MEDWYNQEDPREKWVKTIKRDLTSSLLKHGGEKNRLDRKTLYEVLRNLSSPSGDASDTVAAGIRTDILPLLFQGFASSFLPPDYKVLASEAFFNLLVNFMAPSKVVELFMKCFELEITELQSIDLSFQDGKIDNFSVRDKITFKLALCHGFLLTVPQLGQLEKSLGLSSVLLKVFLFVEKLCCQYTERTTLTFKVLLEWMRYVKMANYMVCFTREVINRIFIVVNGNWENPFIGVKEYNIKLFTVLLDIIDTVPIDVVASSEPMYLKSESMLTQVLQQQPWTMKSKYLMLFALLPKYGVLQALEDFPEFPQGLALSLSHNYLVPAGCSVYRTCVSSLSEAEWSVYFLDLFVEICSNTSVAEDCFEKQALMNYWMPVTAKKFPSSVTVLLTKLCARSEETKTARCNFQSAIYAIISLIKLGRKSGISTIASCFSSGIVETGGDNFDVMIVLERVCGHPSEVVRSEGFSALCTYRKASAFPSELEFFWMQKFLSSNINADNSALREEIIKGVTNFLFQLVRSSKHTLQGIQTRRDVKSKTGSIELQFWDQKLSGLNPFHGVCVKRLLDVHTQSPDPITRVIDFINWLYIFLKSCLEPGTNYQRKISALRLFNTALKCLCVKFSREVSYVGKTYISLKELATDKDSWHFESIDSQNMLLRLVLDPTSDIRDLAANILEKHFCFDKANFIKDIKPLFDQALDLCNSALFYESQSGAALMRIITAWFYKQQKKNKKITFSQLLSERLSLLVEVEPKHESPISEPGCQHKGRADTTQSSPVSREKGDISAFLLFYAKKQWCKMHQDFLQAATTHSPVYGVLRALTCIGIERTGPEAGTLRDEENELLLTLIETMADHLLGILKSNHDTGFSPSFAEMGESIDQIIQESVTAVPQRSTNVMLQDEHQLVLNCICLNLQACCVLSAGLVNSVYTNYEQVERCGMLLVDILTKCRHKGAIESAGSGLSDFVRNVTSRPHTHIEGRTTCVPCIPEIMLKDLLDCVRASSKGASVTRRSAGLAIIVHRIIASDMSPEKPLLHMFMEELFKLVDVQPQNQTSELAHEEIVDLPQAVALHFLQALAKDASLRQHMMQYLEDLFHTAFQKATHTDWRIRNGALQLLGALIPKLCQQKQDQDEEAGAINCLTVEEFLLHFPKLSCSILCYLKKASQFVSAEKHAFLLPLLTLLSKLSIGNVCFMEQHSLKLLTDLSQQFYALLSSSIENVRYLAAKAYSGFTPVCCIPSLAIHHINQVHKLDFRHKIETNHVHGLLMAVKYLKTKLLKDGSKLAYCEDGTERLMNAVKSLHCKPRSNYVKALVLELSENAKYTLTPGDFGSAYGFRDSAVMTLEKILESKYYGGVNVGTVYLANTFIRTHILTCRERDIVRDWHAIFSYFDEDICYCVLGALHTRLQDLHELYTKRCILTQLFNIIVSPKLCPYKIVSSVSAIIQILLDDGVTVVDSVWDSGCPTSKWYLDNIEACLGLYFSKGVPPKCGIFVLPIVCALTSLCSSTGDVCISDLQKKLKQLFSYMMISGETQTFPCKDEDWKTSIALGLRNLCIVIFKAPFNNQTRYENKKHAIIILLSLLQDEDKGVREEAVRTAVWYLHYATKTVFLKTDSMSSHMCIETLLSVDILKQFWEREACVLQFFISRLDLDVESLSSPSRNDLANPFEQTIDNIYAEELPVLDILGSSVLSLIANNQDRLSTFKIDEIELLNTATEEAAAILSVAIQRGEAVKCILSGDGQEFFCSCKKLWYKLMLLLAVVDSSHPEHPNVCTAVKMYNVIQSMWYAQNYTLTDAASSPHLVLQ